MAEIQMDHNPESYNPGDLEMEIVQETDLSANNSLPALKPEPFLKSKALRWHMPIIGEVPLSKYHHFYLICLVVFFIPECGEVLSDVRNRIESHGGMLVDQHECFTYQIKPSDAKLKMRDFYAGIIY